MGASPPTVASATDILTGPLISVVVGLLAIAVSIALFRRGRSRRRLTASVTSRSLLQVGSEVAGEVEILYRDRPVERVHLVTATIANGGNTPILPSDWERDLTIEFPDSGRLLTAVVADVQPAGLSPELTAEPHDEERRIVIAPLLLNPGDSFTASAMVADYTGSVSIHSRIAGIPDLEKERAPRRIDWTEVVGGAVMVMLGGLLLALIAPDALHRLRTSDSPIDYLVGSPHETVPYQIAQLETGKRICVEALGSGRGQLVLRVKNSRDGRLLVVSASEVRLTGDDC